MLRQLVSDVQLSFLVAEGRGFRGELRRVRTPRKFASREVLSESVAVRCGVDTATLSGFHRSATETLGG
jgi:hypothetical protein